MKERFTNVDLLIKVLKTFNILFIIGMCWLFADSMMTCFSDSPVKGAIYAIIGGFYIGAYGAMTSQLWIDSLEERKKE